MLKKANIQWNVNQIVKSMRKGNIRFDNAVQRGYVWDNDRKSLLIHSMIEGYPIPPFYAVKSEDGYYDMLDGKQRSEAMDSCLSNNLVLSNIPEVTIEKEDEEGNTVYETMDINGLTFSQLPEDIQDEIRSYSLTVYYFDSQITDEEINELFFRLNNGKPLSSIELSRAKAKSIDTIKEIGKHEIFTSALTEKAINKYTNEDITIKAWALINVEEPSFETKEIRPLLEKTVITQEQTEEIKGVFTRILETYRFVKEPNDKELNKVAKRIFTRTHLLSLVPVAKQSINDGLSVEEYAKWVSHFFSGKKSASIDETYNNASSTKTASADSVNKRITSIKESYKSYFSNKDTANDGE